MPDTVFLVPYLTCLMVFYIQEAMVKRKQTKNPSIGWSHILNENLSLTILKRKKKFLNIFRSCCLFLTNSICCQYQLHDICQNKILFLPLLDFVGKNEMNILQEKVNLNKSVMVCKKKRKEKK